MGQSLLFIPDISGFTHFVQNTEAEHSEHVIAELLEVLISANTQDLKLAEIEGDALFFYKEGIIPSQEKLLAQMESMFTAFYSHLKILEKNRICPCNACATASDLQLKIVAHSGDLQFLDVQGNRKPFGSSVIEAHRLLKNSVDSDNYVLVSRELADQMHMSDSYMSKLFKFSGGQDDYDGKTLEYFFSEIEKEDLQLLSYPTPEPAQFKCSPGIELEKDYPMAADELMELVTNFKYRHLWVKGVDEFKYDEDEVNRNGTRHTCIVDGKHLDITTITKGVEPNQLVYGERTSSISIIDEFNQFYIITPTSENTCNLKAEVYWKVRSPIKRLMVNLFAKKSIRKNLVEAMDNLFELVQDGLDKTSSMQVA